MPSDSPFQKRLSHLNTLSCFWGPSLFISFLENHSNIFKDVDSVAHTDHEIIFFASLIDDIIKYDGPFSLLLEPIKKQTTNRKNIILTLLSKFFFFKNKRKKQPLTKKHIHIDGHLKTQKSDLFPLTRSCLLYHIYLSVASKPSNASKCLNRFEQLIVEANAAHYRNTNNASEIQKKIKLENACQIVASGMKKWSETSFQEQAPDYHNLAKYLIIHDSVKMRFITFMDLEPLSQTYAALKSEERLKGDRTNPIRPHVEAALNILCKRGIIPLTAEHPKGQLARKIKVFLNYQKTEGGYSKHCEEIYANILRKNRIKSKIYKVKNF
ncbi:hypothetical protein [Terasakiella brassicae]|uniref:hypothetical protein n=1 Tax=Terasakiella brassicae TaxID=1634917 RepID=UPI001667AA36|nr:hypothetical protein [Terasakiella brassicae]